MTRLSVVIASVVGGTVALAALLLVVLIVGMRSYGRGVCRQFATQTGFPTKFVVLGFMDSGTCLAKAPDGRWVLNTQIVQFTGGKP